MNRWTRLFHLYRRYGLAEVSRRVFARGLEGIARGLDTGATVALGYSQELSLDRTYRNLPEEDQRLVARNAQFEMIHKGQRCFVIGNGPSLKTQDLSPLSDEITFVTNAFWKHPIVECWQPTYYCIKDKEFFEDTEGTRAFFAGLRARIDASTFFVPITRKNAVLERKILAPENTHFIVFQSRFLDNGISRSFDITRAIPRGYLVTSLALILAIYMGCSPIYLLGFDHDWLAQLGKPKHFYDGFVLGHPAERTSFSYKQPAEAILRLWGSYENIASLAYTEGIRIVNLTNGGFLDVFERAGYEDVVFA